MRKRLIYLNTIFGLVMLSAFMIIDSFSAANITILVVVMTLIIAFSSFYLNNVWFKHINEMKTLLDSMMNNELVKVTSKSKEGRISDLQVSLVELSEHINTMSTKYGYRKGQLEAIFESLTTGLIAISMDGSIMFHNPKLTELYHLENTIQGQDVYENIYDEHFLKVLNESIKSDMFTLLNIVQSNGLVFNYKGLEIKTKTQRIGTLIVIEDVTKSYKIDKMKADFVSNVTHELKTPLTSIRGFTETLKQVDPNDKETRDKFLGIIETESDRLSLLINDILYLSELEDFSDAKVEKVDVNRIIKEIIDLNQGSLSSSVDITFNADKNYFVTFEQYKLKQMLLNLLSNSVKYTDEGTINISLEEEKDFVILRITDTGIGIPEKDQGRIFERFYRVDKGRSRLTGGTGLGLSIVKHIAERNDCQIHLESEIGTGTTVTIFIKK